MGGNSQSRHLEHKQNVVFNDLAHKWGILGPFPVLETLLIQKLQNSRVEHYLGVKGLTDILQERVLIAVTMICLGIKSIPPRIKNAPIPYSLEENADGNTLKEAREFCSGSGLQAQYNVPACGQQVYDC